MFCSRRDIQSYSLVCYSGRHISSTPAVVNANSGEGEIEGVYTACTPWGKQMHENQRILCCSKDPIRPLFTNVLGLQAMSSVERLSIFRSIHYIRDITTYAMHTTRATMHVYTSTIIASIGGLWGSACN